MPHGDGTIIVSEHTSDGEFHAVVFEKATGSPLQRPMLGAELYHAHGSLLGAIHAASKDFPREGLAARKSWDEERYFTTDIDLVLPEECRQPVREVFAEIHSSLVAPEITRDAFGPVHLDLGYANLHLNDGGRLQAFDFDNCAVGPFALDIAAALYGSIFSGLRCEFAGDRGAFDRPRSGRNLEHVWRPFMDGYSSQNSLPPMTGKWLRACFDALYLRSVVHAWRIQQPIMTPARRQALNADIEHLLHGTLPLNFDFSAGQATG